MSASNNINVQLIQPLMKKFPFSDDCISAFSFISIEEYPIHSHLHMELIYVVEGTLSVKVGVSDYLLHEGEFTIINPFELHALYASDDTNKTCILEINTKFYDPCTEGTIFVSAYNLYEDAASEDFSKIVNTIKKIFTLHLSAVPETKEDPLIFPLKAEKDRVEYEKILLRSLLNYFELHFTSEYFLLSDHKENTLRDNALQADRLKTILFYFYEHFPQKIQLQDVADLTFVNRYHISHLVKSGIGLTFSDLLQHIRIEKAEIYLLGTDMPINQIVFELGFSSYRYFSQHFKSLFHMTPTAYRKKYQAATIRYKDISYLSPTSIYDITEALEALSHYTAKNSSDLQEKRCQILRIPFGELICHTQITEKNNIPNAKHINFPNNSLLYDSPYFAAVMLGCMENNMIDFKRKFPQFFKPDTNISSVFGTFPGNMTSEGIKKASFYLNEFLESLGTESLHHINGCFSAASKEKITFLLYNMPKDILALLSKEQLLSPQILKTVETAAHSAPERKYIFDMNGMKKISVPLNVFVKIQRLQIDLDAFSQWQRLGYPSELDKKMISLFKRSLCS